MPDWVVEAYFRARLAQCSNSDQRYEKLCWNRMMCVVGPGAVLRLPDGQRLRQTCVGFMKSGWLLTLSMNSAAQFFQHVVAWRRSGYDLSSLPYMWAMGDDMLLRWEEGYKLEPYVAMLATTGCIVKHAVWSREFAGYAFKGDGVSPLYPAKHKFTLSYVKEEVEQELLLSYHLLYALDPNSWLPAVREHCRFPVGRMFRMWAMGLIELEMLPLMTRVGCDE
ncbi:hypothetical protein 2 [Hubei sobemo-like virus 6]|uniref:hypothetical protein 2 n=1 Tax=Hubei sobemo-like virus 6 TaxID=1923239 RepID=UPI00090C3E1D|nr:hypothetical protein 2 [Hubei sobemo-like virus 6]APG75836.1 hypothetical protein 2 [Hubei sobemo-like virus 6]